MKYADYTPEFYHDIRETSLRSARRIAPLVSAQFRPKSVIDVGCGSGTWLTAFQELGVADLVGVDQERVPVDQLLIPAEWVLQRDLNRPFVLDRTFDVAVSLEVAEHLKPEAADSFVEALTRLAPVVLFSAAVPMQGGVLHLNEQWPEYWAQRFLAHDYIPVDCLRRHVWLNPDVEWWYAQNAIIYVRRSELANYGLEDLGSIRETPGLAMVHPELYRKIVGKYQASEERCRLENAGVLKLARALVVATSNAIRRRIGGSGKDVITGGQRISADYGADPGAQ